MLRVADIDDSGTIDKDEFYKLVTTVLEAGDKFDIVMTTKVTCSSCLDTRLL